MRRPRVFAPLLVLIIPFVLAACGSTPRQRPLSEVLAGMPAKHLASYRFDPASPLIDRLQTPPEFLLSYLRQMDGTERYTAYTLSKSEREMLVRNLALLPRAYRSALRERLVGIFFVKNFTGSGLADFVLNAKKNLYFLLIINPETMRHDLSWWMSYRASTTFRAGSLEGAHIKLSIDCGSRYSGLTYILLHETSHIMDYLFHYTPYVDRATRELGFSVSGTPFVAGFWKSYDVPTERAGFPLRSRLSFYGLGKGARIDGSRAIELYEGLRRSPFVSLYGSQNWAEDFAEYATWYYLTAKLGQPYRITLTKGGRNELVYEPMKSPLVRQRLRALSSLFE